MALDLEKIRSRLNSLQGKNKRSTQQWKPEAGNEYVVRLLPFPDNEGQPFKERYFYYNIKKYGLLAPHQFGLRDPIQEVINELRDTDTPESYELAKKLYPKMRAYAAVLVRGEEDEGPKVWGFGKQIYEELLGFILNEDYGDITDLAEGNDLKIKIERRPNTQWNDITITPRPKKTPAGSGAEVKSWLSQIPDLDQMYECQSYDELEKIIQDWLTEGSLPDESEGTAHISSSSTDSSDDTVGSTSSSIDDALNKLLA
jgi:hypothetical protein